MSGGIGVDYILAMAKATSASLARGYEEEPEVIQASDALTDALQGFANRAMDEEWAAFWYVHPEHAWWEV